MHPNTEGRHNVSKHAARKSRPDHRRVLGHRRADGRRPVEGRRPGRRRRSRMDRLRTSYRDAPRRHARRLNWMSPNSGPAAKRWRRPSSGSAARRPGEQRGRDAQRTDRRARHDGSGTRWCGPTCSARCTRPCRPPYLLESKGDRGADLLDFGTHRSGGERRVRGHQVRRQRLRGVAAPGGHRAGRARRGRRARIRLDRLASHITDPAIRAMAQGAWPSRCGRSSPRTSPPPSCTPSPSPTRGRQRDPDPPHRPDP